MTVEDIEGAPYAYDDGEYWLFAHCSPGEQIDFAARAEAFAVAQFSEAIQQSISLGALAVSNAGRGTAHAKTTALVKFARKVGQRVHRVVVGETLGHWHRNPHNDHKRELTDAAIRVELQTLRQNREADPASRAMLGRVQEAAVAVTNRLSAVHTVEWRHERKQRLQLEHIKKAIKGTDPVGGFEYVFTAGKTDAAPISDTNLPSPLWSSDAPALASGVVRGLFTYYDGYPLTLGPSRPYVLAFKRATGTTAWAFVKAFKIYGGTES